MDEDPQPTRAQATVEWAGLEQVPPGERHGTPARVGVLWFAAQLVPTAFFLGALGSADYIGLSLGHAMAAIVLGTTVGALAPAALSITGARTGLPQLAYSRAVFGGGTALVGLFAFGTSIAFIALGCILGAEALDVTFGLPFLPAVALVFACVAFVSTLGYRIMHTVERLMAVVVGAGFLLLTVQVVRHAGDVHLHQTVHGGDAAGSFGLLAAASFSFAFAWAHNAADYCRYLPADVSGVRLFVWVWAGIVSACVWLEGLGLLAGSLLPDTSAMAAVNHLVGGGAQGRLVLVALCLGVVANATVAQYSSGLQLMAAGVRLPRPMVTAMTGLVAFALTVYLHQGNLADRFTNVIFLASYWVGPFVGILAVHWWRRRPGRARASANATGTGPRSSQYAAVTAQVVGFLVCLPFSNTTLGTELAAHNAVLEALFGSVARGLLHGADLAYPVGLVVGALVHLCLSRVRTERTPFTEPRREPDLLPHGRGDEVAAP
ncbi:purine-cytosine permease family protein [Streptomyces sp.]|uniref:purine-cytosine permease family protein n=1 Tax=Streptomyces sp. TaxID=1931 RepID=UPI002F3F447B